MITQLKLIFLFVICSILANAQISLRLNYNKNWELTTKDSAVYMRVCTYDTINFYFTGSVTDVYADGKLQMSGSYKEKKKEGDFIFYSKSGTVENQFTFQNNERTGDVSTQLPTKFSITEAFTAAPGVGFETYPDLNRITHNGKVENRSPKRPVEKVYLIVEQQPEVIGGIPAMTKFFRENLQYPKEAKRQRISGSVFVEFIINGDASTTDVRVIKGIGGGCDEEAMRLIKELGEKVGWKPGTQNGKPVRVRFVLPIRF